MKSIVKKKMRKKKFKKCLEELLLKSIDKNQEVDYHTRFKLMAKCLEISGLLNSREV